MPWEPITTADQLVGRFESSTLDYKTTYDLGKPSVRYDIAKDVAAFANAFGGTLVVGAVEASGQAVRLPGVPDVAALTREVAAALLQYCVIIPSTPEDHAITVTPVHAARILAASGARTPTSDVILVTLNVRPDPRGPIGVRPFESTGKQPGPVFDAYRFPLRIDDHTRFLDPTELPMWMNSHERRIAIQLRQIPSHTMLRAFHTPYGTQTDYYPSVYFEGVDEVRGVATFSSPLKNRKARVPLTFISATWQEPGDEGWCIHIEGTLFPGDLSLGYKPKHV